MTLDEAAAWGAATLGQIPERAPKSRADAALLLRFVLQIDAAMLLAHGDGTLTAEQIAQYRAAIAERCENKPIQYITGQQEFFGLPFRVSPAVLIPRPETEHLVEAALERLRPVPAPRIVDIGTGSGCIAVALAHALPQAQVTALDSSVAALEIARKNAQRNGVAARIRFLESDLLHAVQDECFDAVVSNPPYIALEEREMLPLEVREYEPAQALFAGSTGLEIYERVIAEAQHVLAPGGWLMLEIGHGQRDALTSLLRGWREVEFLDDLQGIPRVVMAQRA